MMKKMKTSGKKRRKRGEKNGIESDENESITHGMTSRTMATILRVLQRYPISNQNLPMMNQSNGARAGKRRKSVTSSRTLTK